MIILKKILKFVAIVVFITLFIFAYWSGAKAQLVKVNTSMKLGDQMSYVLFIKRIYESDHIYFGDYNRMPVYPYFQSLFYSPDISEELFFEQGKYRNIFLSFFILISLLFIFRHYFSWLHSIVMVLITAFTVFMFKAGFFQAELLYYFLTFILFLLMLNSIHYLSWKFAILIGIVAGLAHLTKASILPGFILFIVIVIIKWGFVKYQYRKTSQDSESYSLVKLFSIPLMVGLFLITIFPYIQTSKSVFGHYFYNVNSTFYMWYDSWEEVKSGTRAYGDRVGWPNMSSNNIPSMGKYLKDHTIKEIFFRFVNGMQNISNNSISSYGYFKYIFIYTLIFIFSFYRFRTKVNLILKKNFFLIFFLILYFIGYLLLYSWYYPIVRGDRLILSQFLPFMFSLSMGLSVLLNSSYIKIGKYFVPTIKIVNFSLLLILVFDIYFLLLDRVTVMYGGS